MHTILDIFALNELKAQASEGAKHVGRHIQDPFGQTKDMFDDVHKKKMEYELAKQNLIHQTAPTRAVLDRVSQIHQLDQGPVSMNTGLQPNPEDTQDGFTGNRTNDPLGTDPAMGPEVNQGQAGQQLDPASRVPQNMAQTPGQMNQNRPSKAGFQPGVSPGPTESVRPQKMGIPKPGQSNVGQKAGNPSTPQFAPAAPKPKGAGQLPNAKGPGDPKVQNKVKKAQNNSNRGSGGESTARQVNIKIHGNQDCMKGARTNLDAMTGLDALRSCGKMEDDEMDACGRKMEAREFSEEKRKKLAKKGQALPGGGFPIVTKQDLGNARQAIGRAKNPSAAKAHVRERAKDLGVKLPSTWKDEMAAIGNTAMPRGRTMPMPTGGGGGVRMGGMRPGAPSILNTSK